MKKNLVIVESPAKAKTLGRILGDSYSIKASVGHIRDLPKWGLGVSVQDSFAPKYEVPKEKASVVNELKQAAKKATAVYLATDPDREGEAISWHLVEAVDLKGVPIHRVVFHEITEEAITEAFHNPRHIDMHLVDAQQARRILDRLVGYRISPLLCKKVRSKLSAGRVQSVALRLIVEREREIQAFVSQEYWTVEALLSREENNDSSFRAKFVGLASETKAMEIHNQEEADEITGNLREAAYVVHGVKKKKMSRQPAPPFITSSLQQEAWRKLHFTARHTMAVAQQLYEGLSIAGEGTVGLITYMRTDSTAVAETALQETREYIKDKFGADYVPAQPRKFAKKVKGAQEAHEAIRPTKISREVQSIKSSLTSDQSRLYELIWKRMVASQMAAAQFDTTTVDIHARGKEIYLLRATGSIMRFPGFLSLYSEGKDEAAADDEERRELPQLVNGEGLLLIDLFPEQHFTQPPPRYNEASLIKAMEEKGIGRPSTYAPTISTLYQRGYVHREEGRLHPQDIGALVNDLLVEHFPDVVDVGFTAQMEGRLDEIARGKLGWVDVLRDFNTPFEETLDKANANMASLKEPPQPTDEVCPKCGKPMVIRTGRFGRFLACTGFPKCRTTLPLPGDNGNEASHQSQTIAPEPEATDEVCSQCGEPMVVRTGRYGKFLACSAYPKCKTTKRVAGKPKSKTRKK